MKALDFLKSLDGISFGTDAPKESLYEAIAELEEAMKHNSCEGCKYMTTYNETVICSNVCPCSRDYFKDRYEAKEQ